MYDHSDSEDEEDNVIEERYLLAVNVVKATNLKKLPPQPAENATPEVWARVELSDVGGDPISEEEAEATPPAPFSSAPWFEQLMVLGDRHTIEASTDGQEQTYVKVRW